MQICVVGGSCEYQQIWILVSRIVNCLEYFIMVMYEASRDVDYVDSMF